MGHPTPFSAGCQCLTCPYAKKGKPDRPVLAAGLLSLSRTQGVLIGESPGSREVQEGRPFVGMTGQELEHVLNEAGLERSNLVLMNAMACKPLEPKDNIQMLKATDACRPYVATIAELVAKHAPRKADTPILMMGKLAFFSVTGEQSYVSERGFIQRNLTLRTPRETLQRLLKNGDSPRRYIDDGDEDGGDEGASGSGPDDSRDVEREGERTRTGVFRRGR